MKRILITFIIVHISTILFAQDTFYLVQFTDKEETPFTIEHPEEYLSERAINRREIHDIQIDSTDLPVVQTYIDRVEATGAQVWHPLKWFNAIIVSNIDSTEIVKLPNVLKVVDMKGKSLGGINDAKVSNTDFGKSREQLSLLGIDEMHDKGYKGQGVHIAVLDAGFKNYNTNPYFDNLDIADSYDFYAKDSVVSDDHSHGSDVLSTMAANIEGNYVGGAPDATYYLYRTEYVNYESRVEELMWIAAAERADSAGVDLIQSSLGYYSFDDPNEDYTHADLDGKTAWITLGANHAFTKGIFICSSAGNEGDNSWGKITFPSDSPFVLSVGSVDSQLKRASSSSTGLTANNKIKPDVMAKGVSAAIVRSSGTVGVSNGTSFAAPQMSCLVAGLIQALPEGTPPIEIINRLKNAGDRSSQPDSLYGYGIPNFGKALIVTDLEENRSLFKKVKVFPNPVSSDKVTVELPNKLAKQVLEFKWYTMGGAMISSSTKINNTSSFELGINPNYRNQFLILKVANKEYFTTFKLKIN